VLVQVLVQALGFHWEVQPVYPLGALLVCQLVILPGCLLAGH